MLIQTSPPDSLCPDNAGCKVSKPAGKFPLCLGADCSEVCQKRRHVGNKKADSVMRGESEVGSADLMHCAPDPMIHLAVLDAAYRDDAHCGALFYRQQIFRQRWPRIERRPRLLRRPRHAQRPAQTARPFAGRPTRKMQRCSALSSPQKSPRPSKRCALFHLSTRDLSMCGSRHSKDLLH